MSRKKDEKAKNRQAVPEAAVLPAVPARPGKPRGLTAAIVMPGRGMKDVLAALEAGADVNERGSRYNATALMNAVQHGQRDVVQLLLERGADVNLANDNGGTALTLAIFTYDEESGAPDIMRDLIAHGARFDDGGDGGITPLMRAMATGRVKAAGLLLESGAALEATDAKGRTPLMYAAKYGQPELARLLLARGAVLEAASLKGKTALDFAVKEGHEEVARVLSAAAGVKERAMRKEKLRLLHRRAVGPAYTRQLREQARQNRDAASKPQRAPVPPGRRLQP